MSVKLVEEESGEKSQSELDALTDDLNAMIDLIEAALIRKYSIAARVKFQDAESYLNFNKAGSKWGLYFYTAHMNNPGVPLKTVSREIRLEAIKILPELKKELEKANDVSVIKVRSAIEAAEAFLEDL